jgi:hypothetical protein
MNMIHLVGEAVNTSAFFGAMLAATLAIMSNCSLVAPSDTPIIRKFRRGSFAFLAVALMLACTWPGFDPSHVPSEPALVLVVAIDCLLTVSLVSAIILNRRRHRSTVTGQLLPE